MSTITIEQEHAIAAKLASMTLPSGLGTVEAACSIAAINLALTGKLTDDIPPCMSDVIGKWIIKVQDSMPEEMRNSARWKSLLPLAAGTGRVKEKERLDIILEWMWGTVLPSIQPIADTQGFGTEWKRMTTECTKAAAQAAAARASEQAWAAETAAEAARAASRAAEAAAVLARAANAAARAGERAAVAAVVARAANAAAWQTFDPCGLLDKLIDVQ